MTGDVLLKLHLEPQSLRYLLGMNFKQATP